MSASSRPDKTDKSDRPDLDAGYGRRRRSGPPAEDDRDPVDPPRAEGSPAAQGRSGESRTDQPDPTASSAGSDPLRGDRTMTEAERYQLTRQLGLQVSLAHHEMINALAAQRKPPKSRKRYVLEDAIQALYDREIGGNP